MDIIKSFMLEDNLFRGSLVSADTVVHNIWQKHDYPLATRPLFSQAITVALALSAGIKYQGVFALQIKGDGPISSLFVDVTTDKKVRGYMTFNPDKVLPKTGKLSDFLGRGQMIFSVAGLGQEPYQGIVAINQENLADVVMDYFRLSEQIDTDFIIRTQGELVRILMLQKMPNKEGISAEKAANLWETVTVLLNSVQDKELFSDKLSADDILFRLFHANELVVFPEKTPIAECRCYRGKMEAFLKKMDSKERQRLYDSDGIIRVSCQFCGETYTFQRSDFKD